MINIIIMFQSAILALLAYGSYTDWKYREVSNWVNFPIILLNLPLIWLNLPQITLGYFIIALIYVGGYWFNQIGGADLKALISIVFSLNPIHLSIFFVAIVIFSIPFVRKNPNDIPLFIPIFLGYSLNTFIV